MDAQALGRFLRETREAKELTLEDAERSLRIRQRILDLHPYELPEGLAVPVSDGHCDYLALIRDPDKT
mgnify:CR=1 FL=1